jgi:hypothetical protein
MLQAQNMHHYFIPVVRGIFQKGILLKKFVAVAILTNYRAYYQCMGY